MDVDVDLEEESPPQKVKAAEEDLAVDESTISGGGGNSVSSSGVASLSAEESHAAKCSLIVDCLRYVDILDPMYEECFKIPLSSRTICFNMFIEVSD